jgi:hypothetical protein
MNCPNCAKQISDTAKVCGYCGTRLVRPEPPPETPAPPDLTFLDEAPEPEQPESEPTPTLEKESTAPKPDENPLIVAAPPVKDVPAEPQPADVVVEEPPQPEPKPEPEPAQVVEAAVLVSKKTKSTAQQPAKPRKRMPGWAWAAIGLVVLVILAVVFIGPGLRPAQPDSAAAEKPAPTEPKPAPTSAPQEAQVEEDYQLVQQYAEDWYGADLVQEYDFDDFSFWVEEGSDEEVLVYASNYEELDGYIRLIGDGSWMTWFCDHHFQPGHASVSVFTLEEDSNFSIGYLSPWANFGEAEYLWWGISGPEGEAGTYQVDEADNIHFLSTMEPDTTYWVMLANEGSDFLIQLGDVEKDIVLGETILYMDTSWDLEEWKYCVSVGSGVVDLHYYGVRSLID